VIGENKDTTIITGVSGEDHVVRISSKNAEISGFTIRGAAAGQDGVTVILLMEDTTISNNIIEDSLIGILLQAGSARTEVSDNIIKNNEYEGIQLTESDRNDIAGNTIESNGGSGIALETLSKQNEITNNTIEDNLVGIKLLGGSSQNIISGNKILNNEREGIFSEGLITTANDITINNISNNRVGIKISRGGKNILTDNNILDNKVDGVYLTLSNENIIEMNNFIGNRKNARVIISFRNSWDANYWDDWIGLKIPLFSSFPKVIKALFLRSFDMNPQDVPYNINI
jgi:parallel beta-helix repeat protein